MYCFIVKDVSSGIILKQYYSLSDLYNELDDYLSYVKNKCTILIYKDE